MSANRAREEQSKGGNSNGNLLQQVDSQMLADALLDEKPLEPVKRAAPFLQKTYDMIEEEGTNDVVSWAEHGRSFVVWRPEVLQSTLLPKFFKHNNYSSFVRQLNTYGFRKMNPERWEFAQPDFIRGQRERLINIVRKRSSKNTQNSANAEAEQAAVVPLSTQRQPAVEVGNYGSMNSDLERVKRDNNILTMEILKLRQQQQRQQQQIEMMQQRLMSTESTQMQMMNAFHQAVENPELFHELLQRLNTSGVGADPRRKRRAIRNTEEPSAPMDMVTPSPKLTVTSEAPDTSTTRLHEIVADGTDSASLGSNLRTDTMPAVDTLNQDILFTPISPPTDPFNTNINSQTAPQMQFQGDNIVPDPAFDGLSNINQGMSAPSNMNSTETAEQAMLDALLDGFSLGEERPLS